MNSSNQFVSAFEIKTFLIDISEKIDEKNLSKFCKTQLTLNDYSLSENDFLGSIYLEESSKQFIFTTTQSIKRFYFELFYDFVNQFEEKFSCVVCNDVVYVYKYKKLYYFQVLDFSLSDDELKNLIFEKLNISIDRIIRVSNEELENIQNKELSKTTIINLNSSKKINYFRIFVIYILVLLLGTAYFINDKYNEKPKPKIKEYYSYKSKDLENIVNYLNSLNIQIYSIINERKTKVEVSIKKEVYTQDLIKKIKKKFKISSSVFDEKLNQYKVELYAK